MYSSEFELGGTAQLIFMLIDFIAPEELPKCSRSDQTNALFEQIHIAQVCCSGVPSGLISVPFTDEKPTPLSLQTHTRGFTSPSPFYFIL